MDKHRKALIKDLDQMWRDTVKERDNYTCQWCGEKVSGRGAHAAHVVPRSNGYRLRWNTRNGKCLCYKCHAGKWHEGGLGRQWFDEKYPEEIEYLLEEKAKGGIKLTTTDLEEKLAEF